MFSYKYLPYLPKNFLSFLFLERHTQSNIKHLLTLQVVQTYKLILVLSESEKKNVSKQQQQK
jgi:hypothetical protein